MEAPRGFTPKPADPDDFVDRFCRATNRGMEMTVFPNIREGVRIRDRTEPQGDFWKTVLSPPEVPGLSRPVWLVIAASVPTALGWYGYYKFSVMRRSARANALGRADANASPRSHLHPTSLSHQVEEELFYDELRREGRATGCGGYGTLFPFVWCILFGGAGTLAGIPNSDALIELGAAWILLGQVAQRLHHTASHTQILLRTRCRDPVPVPSAAAAAPFPVLSPAG